MIYMNKEPADEVQPSRSGWKKTLIVMVLLLIAAIGGVICMALPPKEPSYNGQPLSYWLARCEEAGPISADTKDPKALECREAIRHIGTNAIPFLMRMLRAKDSALKLELRDLVERQDYIHFRFSEAADQNYKAANGFYCLDDLATNSVPALIDVYNKASSPSSKHSADYALMAMYPAAGAAMPYWVPPQERAQWYSEAGQLKSQLGAQSNAILAFSEAIKLAPTNVPAHLNRASAKMQLQDFAGALSDANRSIELDSSNRTAFYTRGSCKFALKDFKSADADFTTAIQLYTHDVNAYNSRGITRANLRQLDDALADFTKAAELSPGEATYYRNCAIVEGLQKEYELALADASKSIELDGKDAIAYIVRGRVKSALKDYKSALPDFDKAIEMNPKDPAAYAARGAARMLMDDFESASADLAKALQLDPKSVNAYVVRGYLKAKRGGEDDGALADLEHAVALGAQVPETHGVLGLFQYKISRWVPALENCRKALELGSLAGTADLRSYIWLIRAQTGEEADANRELETYLNSLQGAKTNEWDASIARFLSGSLAESNFLGQATTTAKRPSAVRGQVCESLYYAGMKRKLAGDKQGALELFQKCLDTRDDNNFGYLNAGIEMRALKNK
jgi:tetratricopeptide (TPR) repeat protein